MRRKRRRREISVFKNYSSGRRRRRFRKIK